MEQFKKKLRVRIAANIISGIVILACVIIGAVITIGPDTTEFSSFHLGFQVGLTAAVELFMILGTVKYLRVLRSEEKLKKLYYEENDERTRAISEKTGGSVLYVCTIILLAAGIIAGYFNSVVFFTLLSCAAFLLVTRGGLSFYYSKKL